MTAETKKFCESIRENIKSMTHTNAKTNAKNIMRLSKHILDATNVIEECNNNIIIHLMQGEDREQQLTARIYELEREKSLIENLLKG